MYFWAAPIPTPVEELKPHEEMLAPDPWHHELTDKQRRFVEEYCIDFNGAAAARRAGYSEDTANVIASQNLTKLNIRNAVDAYLKERSMSAAEAIDKLTQWGRGNVKHFLIGGEITLTMPDAVDNLHLLKEVDQFKTTHSTEDSVTETVRTKIKLHDPMAAVTKILEVHGKIINRSDITSGGKPLPSVHRVIFEDFSDGSSHDGSSHDGNAER